MNRAEVAREVQRIAAIAGDDENAHIDEDLLRHNVLRAIADELTDDPAGIAAEALRTTEIEFKRWCA